MFRLGFRRWWRWPKVVAFQVHDHTLSFGELRAAVEYDDAVDYCAFDCHAVCSVSLNDSIMVDYSNG